MRRILLNLSLLVAVAAPLAAHAQEDILTLTSPTQSYTYIVPASPTVFTTPTSGPDVGLYFELTGVPVTATPGGSSSDTVDFLTAAAGTGFYDDTSLLNVIGPTFFTDTLVAGVLTDPVFTLGSGPLGSADDENNINYSWSVAAYTPPAPEPSSLVLLGTGVLGLFGAFRRRLLR
jgi:hypothetical protein